MRRALHSIAPAPMPRALSEGNTPGLAIAAVMAAASLVVASGLRPQASVAIALGLSLIVAALVRPDIVALSLILWVPIETTILKYVPGGDMGLIVVDVACLAVISSVALGFARRRVWFAASARAILIPLALICMAAVVGWLHWRPPLLDAIYFARVWLRFVPVGLLLVTHPWRVKLECRLLPVVAISAAVQVVAGVAEYLGGSAVAVRLWPGSFQLGSLATSADTYAVVSQAGRLVAGTVGYYNIYALFLVCCLCWLVAGLVAPPGHPLRVSRRWRGTVIALATLAALCVVLSQSRQGVIAMLLGTVLALPLLRGARFARISAASLLVATTIGLTATSLGAGLAPTAARLSELQTNEFWSVFQTNRGYGAELAFRALELSPFYGLGPGSLAPAPIRSQASGIGFEILGANPVWGQYVNDLGWATLAGQLGILGLMAFGMVAFWCLRSIWRRGLDRSAAFLMIGVLMVLTGMFASTPLSYKPTGLLFWVTLGYVAPYLMLRRPIRRRI